MRYSNQDQATREVDRINKDLNVKMLVGVYWIWEIHERESTPDQMGDRLDQGHDFKHLSGKMLECYIGWIKT